MLTIYYTPHMLPLSVPIKGVSLGESHGVAWDSLGNVYSWGEIKDGKLGHHMDETSTQTMLDTPTKIAALRDHKMIMAICGSTYSCGLNSKGEILVWGHFDKGSGGVQKGRRQEQLKPRVLQPLNSSHVTFVKITGFGRHNAAIDKDGELYTWGDK